LRDGLIRQLEDKNYGDAVSTTFSLNSVHPQSITTHTTHMFIELTSKDGKNIRVNLRTMSVAERRDSETAIVFPVGGHFPTMYVFVKELPEAIYEKAKAAGTAQPFRLVQGRAGSLIVNLDMVSAIEPLASGTRLTVPNAGGAYSHIEIANAPEGLVLGKAGPL
jgi:hypothetical protein